MKIENIDIQATIEKAHALVRNDEQLSAATKSMFEILILVVTLPANRRIRWVQPVAAACWS
jgi:hypothetical protein